MLQVILQESFNALGECTYILYNIEMIMLTTEMMRVFLTREVENPSRTVRYYNKKIAGQRSYIKINYRKSLLRG
jgi:hypothetical protein